MSRRRAAALEEAPMRADDWWAAASQPTPPHHIGHRERLRQRAHLGLAALPDYELIELFLFRSLPQGDVKPLAKALLDRFGGLAAVLGADPEALKTVKGVGASVALDLKLLHEATLRVGRAEVAKRPVISSWSALLTYTKAALAHAPREQFRVLFLDKKNQMIADEVMNEGTVDHAPVYPREVARRALELSASAVILVHNHPSGDPTPSAADIDMTRQVVEAGRTLRIAVHDHLVVGREGGRQLQGARADLISANAVRDHRRHRSDRDVRKWRGHSRNCQATQNVWTRAVAQAEGRRAGASDGWLTLAGGTTLV